MWLQLRDGVAQRSTQELESAVKAGHPGLVRAAQRRAQGLSKDASEASAAAALLESRLKPLQACAASILQTECRVESLSSVEQLMQSAGREYHLARRVFESMNAKDAQELKYMAKPPELVTDLFEAISKLMAALLSLTTGKAVPEESDSKGIVRLFGNCWQKMPRLPELVASGAIHGPLDAVRTAWAAKLSKCGDEWSADGMTRSVQLAGDLFKGMEHLLALDDKLAAIKAQLPDERPRSNAQALEALKPVLATKALAAAWSMGGGDFEALEASLQAIKAHASRARERRDSALQGLEEMLAAGIPSNTSSLRQRLEDCIEELGRTKTVLPAKLGQLLQASSSHRASVEDSFRQELRNLLRPQAKELTPSDQWDQGSSPEDLPSWLSCMSTSHADKLDLRQLPCLAEAVANKPFEGAYGDACDVLSDYLLKYLPLHAAWEAAEAEVREADAALARAEQSLEVVKALPTASAATPAPSDTSNLAAKLGAAGYSEQVEALGLKGLAMPVQQASHAEEMVKHAGSSLLMKAPGKSAPACDRLGWLAECIELPFAIVEHFMPALRRLTEAGQTTAPRESLQSIMLKQAALELLPNSKAEFTVSGVGPKQTRCTVLALLSWYCHDGCDGSSSDEVLYSFLALAAALAPFLPVISDLAPARALLVPMKDSSDEAAASACLEKVQQALANGRPEEPWWWLRLVGCEDPEAFYKDYGFSAAKTPIEHSAAAPSTNAEARPVTPAQAAEASPQTAGGEPAASEGKPEGAQAAEASPQTAGGEPAASEGKPEGAQAAEASPQTAGAEPAASEGNPEAAQGNHDPGAAPPATQSADDVKPDEVKQPPSNEADDFEPDDLKPQASEEDDYGFEAEPDSQIVTAAADTSAHDGYDDFEEGFEESTQVAPAAGNADADDEFEADD
eukprot:TRINITY_DN10653_c0_g1_i1.p1 TRINITY_DN10653_c0_g1~~TRINITY_DN10653_c0_g1_i1.p1  ORF type:complete len:952 (-),score=294.24 TRINITY_DN10653_c0_g1_i1:51-2780(-)